MKRLWRCAMLAVASLISAGAVAHAAPLTCAYKGNGSDGRNGMVQFNALLGRQADCAVDFIDFSSWTGFDNDAGWGIGGWKGSGYKLVESVPLTVNGTSLATVASGAEDQHYKQLAQTLINNGFDTAYVRLGWEFNGNWYPWQAGPNKATFIAAFQHVVSVMRSVPGAKFRFVWCTALGTQQVAPDQAYPGDSFVDVIATDAYNSSWDAGYTVPETMWNSDLNDNWGLRDVLNFAKAHGKSYAFPEWGTGTRPDGHGGGDSPLFIANMTPLVEGAEFAGYWDYNAGDYAAQITGATPLTGTMGAFMAAFGSSTAGSRASVTAEQAMGATVMAHSAATRVISATDALASTVNTLAVGAQGASPTVACTGCHVGVIKNAAGHYLMFVWATETHPTVTVKWTGHTTAANLYDPARGPFAVKTFGGANSATFTLVPNKQMVLAMQQ